MTDQADPDKKPAQRAPKDKWFATENLVMRIDGANIEWPAFEGRPLAETAIAVLKEAKQFDGLVAAGVLVRKPPIRPDRSKPENRDRIQQRLSDQRGAA